MEYTIKVEFEPHVKVRGVREIFSMWSNTSGIAAIEMIEPSTTLGAAQPQDKGSVQPTADNTGSTCASQIADEMDFLIKDYSVYWTTHLDKLKQWSRQLRTCQ